MRRLLLIIILFGFSVLSALALWHHGYWGIIAPQFQTYGARQVLADLVIALGLFSTWMWRDARTSGRNPWPWIALTLIAGSFGPLIYLLSQRSAKSAG
jgi:hypothetical protein